MAARNRPGKEFHSSSRMDNVGSCVPDYDDAVIVKMTPGDARKILGIV
jgi:hypothetical protein